MNLRELPTDTERDEFHAVVIRTDYGDQSAWNTLTAELMQPWGENYEALAHFVDDPAWAGATVDDVRDAASVDPELTVLFIADSVTMGSAHHALLAVNLRSEEEDDAFEDEDESVRDFGREFRTIPPQVHSIHANLSLANMDFEEFAAAAEEDPEKVFRSF
ncbi:DUF6924 domain-containing protein [Streptomyces subrutilus]|uniref:DUF6924 domain-containing protein n=1 Tax=Streptomyces subrutilus TaxID=36818 RepID=UPI0033CC52DD